jgi:hypothetical protein
MAAGPTKKWLRFEGNGPDGRDSTKYTMKMRSRRPETFPGAASLLGMAPECCRV